MSIKSTVFQEFLGNPLNTFNFVCVIPALEGVQMLVAATDFPQEMLQEFQLHYQGERVKFPSIPTNDGVWRCTMQEGELQKVNNAFRSYMKEQYDQKTGMLTHWSITDKFDIEVYPRRLKGDVNGSDKVFGIRMHGCFMKGRANVSLDNANPIGDWKWQIEFSYDWLEDIDGPAVVGK